MMAFEGNSIQTFVRNFFSDGTSVTDKDKTLLCIGEENKITMNVCAELIYSVTI